ncbi:MAG TPA: ABC transporter ATP-binding protein [Planosporangium sp.]|jgi:putative ABC transport system ATP-binding protein|nr:ABC transporter ATP-binding protein [Planosporangium sp.]
MPTEPAAAEAIDVTRGYRAGGQRIRALEHVSLAVARGEVVAVMGPSGSGKSTLLYLLGGLDDPDEGEVRITGVDWRRMRGRARARFRRRACGFITQSLALLPQATAAENVEVPLLLDHVDAGARRRRTAEALDRVGLADAAAKLPDQLSGGQQQRIAIARALVAEPAVILADEPTGSLDSETAEAVIRLLLGVSAEQDAAVVIVTHAPAIASHADRVLTLHSGRLDATALADHPGGTC